MEFVVYSSDMCIGRWREQGMGEKNKKIMVKIVPGLNRRWKMCV